MSAVGDCTVCRPTLVSAPLLSPSPLRLAHCMKIVISHNADDFRQCPLWLSLSLSRSHTVKLSRTVCQWQWSFTSFIPDFSPDQVQQLLSWPFWVLSLIRRIALIDQITCYRSHNIERLYIVQWQGYPIEYGQQGTRRQRLKRLRKLVRIQYSLGVGAAEGCNWETPQHTTHQHSRQYHTHPNTHSHAPQPFMSFRFHFLSPSFLLSLATTLLMSSNNDNMRSHTATINMHITINIYSQPL